MSTFTADTAYSQQQDRNDALLASTHYMRDSITSEVLPLTLDPTKEALTQDEINSVQAIEIEAARIAIRTLASLAKIGELDHLGGGLDLTPALTMTIAMTDYDLVEYTIENAHTSIGYYSVLAALGFIQPDIVINEFRRGLDIAGHVSWVPGGSQLNGGRLGIMVPAAVGQALGIRGRKGDGAWVICHCGDAGWISGQALNGFNGADLHDAPVTFVMHRNGIQLSGSNKAIMDKDPRPIIESLGITIIETPSIHDTAATFEAYRQARAQATLGRPTLIYPVGYRNDNGEAINLTTFGERYGIGAETAAFAAEQGVSMDTAIWIPGALMSYRDVGPMLECLFLVNELPGGEGHHDGHMKGRDDAEILNNPMMQHNAVQAAALEALRAAPPRTVVTTARPAPGSPNLVVPASSVAAVELPPAGKKVSARAGSEAGYDLVARHFPESVFVVSCDLDPSTKLGKARGHLAADHQFEMSIEEQASAIMANGLACSSHEPQLNVFSTFAAFFDGIAREGLQMWTYQRNLNGINEGLNVTYHLSHVGSCTGRDHFTGWSLDWLSLGIGILPYLHRLYAPSDARSAFLAVKDLAAHSGGHVICIPRDNLPVLAKQDGSGALWEASDRWEAVTEFRTYPDAKRAILAVGAPVFVAEEAAAALSDDGIPTDVHIINGLPLPSGTMSGFIDRYPDGIATIEDNMIGTPDAGLRGLAGLVASATSGIAYPLAHVGITDPRIAPSEGHMETWAHFGITSADLVAAVQGLRG